MIYAIQCGREGPIKIGVARDPQKRLADLQVGCPYELFLVAAGDLPDSAEREFHRQLWDYSVRGEWFQPHENVWDAAREIGRIDFVGPEQPRLKKPKPKTGEDALAAIFAYAQKPSDPETFLLQTILRVQDQLEPLRTGREDEPFADEERVLVGLMRASTEAWEKATGKSMAGDGFRFEWAVA